MNPIIFALRHPFTVMVAIIGELSRVTGEEYGGWVHWGATTQNIQRTGDVLGIRTAHRIITSLLTDVLGTLADLADAHADTLTAGRTHFQQAVPITFGFKAAAWADAMGRSLERLDQLAGRLLIAMAGGATGTFAAMGPLGPRIQDVLEVCEGVTEISITVNAGGADHWQAIKAQELFARDVMPHFSD